MPKLIASVKTLGSLSVLQKFMDKDAGNKIADASEILECLTVAAALIHAGVTDNRQVVATQLGAVLFKSETHDSDPSAYTFKELCDIEWELERFVNHVRAITKTEVGESLRTVAYVISKVRSVGQYMCNTDTYSGIFNRDEMLLEFFNEICAL